MEEDKNKNEKLSKKKINRNSAAYLRQRKKANARKCKFLNKMTPEQREMKREKDKEYYQRKKAEKKTKSLSEMFETHFGASKGQSTIHTGAFYSKNVDSVHTATFATVSNNLDHQAHAVWGHMKPILQTILSTREHVQTLHIFSDGPTSQY